MNKVSKNFKEVLRIFKKTWGKTAELPFFDYKTIKVLNIQATKRQ